MGGCWARAHVFQNAKLTPLTLQCSSEDPKLKLAILALCATFVLVIDA